MFTPNMCHMSCATCHKVDIMDLVSAVEGLLSTGPTPSSLSCNPIVSGPDYIYGVFFCIDARVQVM